MSDELEPTDRRATLRASDVDRNRVVDMLSDALGLGQITFSEYEERSQDATTARTYADLDRLVEDLPAAQTGNISPTSQPARAYQAPLDAPAGVPRVAETKYAVMSEAKVRGPVAVGAEHNAIAFWGEVTLDLREATFLVAM